MGSTGGNYSSKVCNDLQKKYELRFLSEILFVEVAKLGFISYLIVSDFEYTQATQKKKTYNPWCYKAFNRRNAFFQKKRAKRSINLVTI